MDTDGGRPLPDCGAMAWAGPRRPQVPESIEKIVEVDEHIGCAMSGLTADARTLINHGRVETQVGETRSISAAVVTSGARRCLRVPLH